MKQIDELIAQFQAVAANPAKAVADYKAETGKGAVGMMPLYAPEEIVHAAGYLPIGMWGAQKQSIAKARTYLPPFTCSVMQSVMELQLNGTYDCLDAVVFSTPCDTLQCMSQLWHGKAPIVVFTHPQNRKISAAVPFLKAEYAHVKAELERILGVTISEEAIENSIKVYNENRQIMREFCDVAAQYPQIFDPAKRHAVIKARWFMEKSKHTALVRELIDAVKAQPVQPWSGKKIILSGIMAEPNELLDLLKEFNFAVVADDLAQESRQYRNDVPAGCDPLEQLAQWWQDFDGCPLATNEAKPRGPMLIQAAEKYQADAVVICMMKFCDPEEFDYPIYHMEFDAAGLRHTVIEMDQESTAFEQIRTRLQAFAELL
jgi:bcr-type benzoyl-CoA reductase subunit C